MASAKTLLHEAARHPVAPMMAALLVYHRVISGFFAQDDITFLSRAAGLQPGDAFRLLSESLAFRIQYAAFGLDPRGYLAVNLGLHLFNTLCVYHLALRLTRSRGTASAAAVLFGCSSVAFTPLHWATGIVELLTGALLLVATVLHLRLRDRGGTWLWVPALAAFAAMLSKETALLWPAAVALIEWKSDPRGRARSLVPAAVASVLFVACFFGSGQAARFADSQAYSRTVAPTSLVANLLTYAGWSVALWNPIRDQVAAVSYETWPLGAAIAIAALLAVWQRRRDAAVVVGAGWWLAFLLPVLPLEHHTNLYYLYVPMAGGAIAVAACGAALFKERSAAWLRNATPACLAAYVLVEGWNVHLRETMRRDYLPADRTVRDSELLSHALPALRAAKLPAGAGVLFVSPLMRPRFDLMRGAPTRPEDVATRVSYLPLEAAMRGGQTLKLFLPEVVYLGFARTIPRELESAHSFHYEQRGWLEHWGQGQKALLNQGRVQLAGGQWLAAESTFVRVRDLGDTLPAALVGQAEALAGSDRIQQALAVTLELERRWPRHATPRGIQRTSP